jgi:hypothetical protein
MVKGTGLYNSNNNRGKKAVVVDVMTLLSFNLIDCVSIFFRSTPSITRLATQVKEAVDADPISGPRKDRANHLVGVEFEVVLEQMLKERGMFCNSTVCSAKMAMMLRLAHTRKVLVLALLGIPYESESQLREKGTSKTPDVVL